MCVCVCVCVCVQVIIIIIIIIVSVSVCLSACLYVMIVVMVVLLVVLEVIKLLWRVQVIILYLYRQHPEIPSSIFPDFGMNNIFSLGMSALQGEPCG